MSSTIKGIEPAANEALAAIERKSGPSNFLRVMAHRPEAMEAFTRFYGVLMGPRAVLDRRIKEMVYLAVSYVNECAYCAAHHAKSAVAAGLSDNELREIETESNHHFSPREQAALRYARDLTRNASVGDSARYGVRELFSPDESVELTMIVGLANFTNRFNNGLDVPLDIARSAG
jgi:uncharacterized peroxidase-related enzyme